MDIESITVDLVMIYAKLLSSLAVLTWITYVFHGTIQTYFSSERISVRSSIAKLATFVVCVTLFFILYHQEENPSGLLYCIVKCLPVLSLVSLVIHGNNNFIDSQYKLKVLFGLIFSCLGDAFLVGDSKFGFGAGLLMFAAAHLMYILAFGWKDLKLLSGVVYVVVALLGYALLRSCGNLHGVLSFLVPVYIALISVMAWRAFARIERVWRWTNISAFVGSHFFLLSDFTLAINQFCVHFTGAHVITMLTYYISQLGIALSVTGSALKKK